MARYLLNLEKQVTSLQRQEQGTTPAPISSAEEDRTSPRHSSTAQTAANDLAMTNPLVTNGPQLVHTDRLLRPVYVGDASGIAFGMKLRQLVRGDRESEPSRTQHKFYRNPRLLRTTDSHFNLPEQSYAVILVKVVKRFLGDSHHLDLESTFMQRLQDLYRTDTEDQMWICRLFMIFALGKLYSNDLLDASSKSSVPGKSPGLT